MSTFHETYDKIVLTVELFKGIISVATETYTTTT